MQFITSTIQKKSTSVTLKEAFCTDERYTRASWINVIMIINHELTGINVVLMYSSTILETILGTGGGFNARQGTYVVALVNAFSAFTGIFTVQVFGRRTLFLYGHFGIFISYMLMSTFIITGMNSGVLTMMCVFLFVYQNTSGQVGWLYAVETCTDISLGICLQALWGTVLLLSLTSETLMDSALQPQGVFYMFGVFSLFAFVFVYFFLDETKGLSEKQKKALYIPGAKYGRKLRSEENPDDFPTTPFAERRPKYTGLASSLETSTMTTLT